MIQRIYLDHNATTALRPEAAEAAQRCMAMTGNASSVHGEGRAARAVIEEARDAVAALAGAGPRTVVFTGSATEALNLVLTPSLQLPGDDRPWRLLVSPLEHSAVLNGHRFAAADVKQVGVDRDGVVDLADLERRLVGDASRRPLVALQLANNEIGVVQPVAEAARLVHAAGGAIVVDAVQGARFLDCGLDVLGADAIVLSAHKLGGVAGSGALVRRSDLHIAAPLIRGGGQEGGLSAGTHNLIGIAAMGAAARATLRGRTDEAERARQLQDDLEAGLRAIDPGITILAEHAERLPNTTAFAARDLDVQSMLVKLDLAGIAVSSGSACSSGRVARSRVLEVLGFDHDLRTGMLRLSTGWNTRSEDIAGFLEAWRRLCGGLSATGTVFAA